MIKSPPDHDKMMFSFAVAPRTFLRSAMSTVPLLEAAVLLDFEPGTWRLLGTKAEARARDPTCLVHGVIGTWRSGNSVSGGGDEGERERGGLCC